MKIAAVVVLYYPEVDLLIQNLSLIDKQVDQIFLIDNTPESSIGYFQKLKLDCPISYIPLINNTGIAYAQNLGTRLAIQSGCDQFIYFDQDSTPRANMVTNLISAQESLLNAGINLGVIGPSFIESKSKKRAKVTKHFGFLIYKSKINNYSIKPIQVDYIISSGSMIRVEVLEVAGYFNESFFIDWVDIEFCLRASNFGFKNFVVPSAKMLHSLGDKVVKLGKFDIFHKHADFRNYYIVRNATYLVFHSNLPLNWRIYIAFKLPFYLIFFSLTSFSRNRIKVFSFLIKAFIDGAKARLGKAF